MDLTGFALMDFQAEVRIHKILENVCVLLLYLSSIRLLIIKSITMLNQRKSKLISFLFILPAFIFLFSHSFRQDRSQHGRGHYGQAGLREGRHVAPLTKYWSLSTPARKCSSSIIVTEKSCTTPRTPKQ